MALKIRSLGWTAIAIALALASTVISELPGVAVRYQPPSNLQRPAGRQGGATRAGCVKNNFTFAALVPTSNYGQTTAAYPTLYWYHSNHIFSWARFELFATQAQTVEPEATPTYQSTFPLERGTTLTSLTLPDTAGLVNATDLPPLATGREYLWKVTLICSPVRPDNDTADGSQHTIQGWITRVEPSAELKLKLSKTQRPYGVYAEEGLWYDAIHDLAELRRQQPQLKRLTEDWQTLLEETDLRSNQPANLP